MRKRMLLHICCAPCSASAVKILQDDFDISFYWFNPNIYDEEEYLKRYEAAKKYARSLGINFYEEDFKYDYGQWLLKSSEICGNCYEIRLGKSAEFAKKNKFDFFTTSLLSSPYQKHDLVRQTGEKAADGAGTEFYYADFRPSFYEGKNFLRKAGYYVQKYCGCEKSKKERFSKNEQK